MSVAFALFALLAIGCAQGGGSGLPDVGHVSHLDGAMRDGAEIDAATLDAARMDGSMEVVDAFTPSLDASMTCSESTTRPCSTACGSGIETCMSGMFRGCTAPMPRAEVCNRADEDCDTRIDEGLQVQIFDPVPMSELAATLAACNGPNAGISVCMAASKRWCTSRAEGCFNGGAGHLQASATTSRVACFGSRAVERMTTFGEISVAAGIAVNSDNADTRVAQSAANRYCRSLAYEVGIGPVEFNDTNVWVMCLPNDLAAQTRLMMGELQARGCNPNVDPNTFACQSAADHECRARGFVGGVGPVEWNLSLSVILCLR